MPQLNPFYFSNQTIIVFICITYIVYLLSKYLMPEPFKGSSGNKYFL